MGVKLSISHGKTARRKGLTLSDFSYVYVGSSKEGPPQKGESYLAVEQFRQRTHYLAEQFRQIAHYLAEHLIQKNDVLFNVKFLTLWVQECKYAECRYACMQVLKYANMHVCKCASMQVYKYTIMQVCNCIQAYTYANL